VCQFILSRFAMLIEFLLIIMPVALLVVKVMQWTGNYVVLAFFLCTAAVTLLVKLIYPRLIEPLFSTNEELPEWMSPLRFHIVHEAERAGFGGGQDIFMERSNFNDMHANASASMGKIKIGLPLIKVHAKYPCEIVAILVHELGHFKQKWWLTQAVVDTVYMVVYGTLLWMLTNSAPFLLSFGFYQQSYFASFYLFTSLYLVSLDVPIRIGMRWISRWQEIDADNYAVSRGYGVEFKSALIRSYASSHDNLFTSWIDRALNDTHPTLCERLANIDAQFKADPSLEHQEKNRNNQINGL